MVLNIVPSFPTLYSQLCCKNFIHIKLLYSTSVATCVNWLATPYAVTYTYMVQLIDTYKKLKSYNSQKAANISIIVVATFRIEKVSTQ